MDPLDDAKPDASSPIKSSRRRKRLVRWETRRIEQFGYLINAVLVLATASLGFAIALLQSPTFTMKCAAALLWWVGVILLTFSVAATLLCSLVRLWNFRGTADRLRIRHSQKASKHYLRQLGTYSWRLLYTALLSFLGGVVAIGTSVIANRFHR